MNIQKGRHIPYEYAKCTKFFRIKLTSWKKMYFTLVNYYDPIIIHLYHSPILITLQVNHDIYMLITTISSNFLHAKRRQKHFAFGAFYKHCRINMLFHIISSPLVASIMQFALSFLRCRVVLFRT